MRFNGNAVTHVNNLLRVLYMTVWLGVELYRALDREADHART